MRNFKTDDKHENFENCFVSCGFAFAFLKGSLETQIPSSAGDKNTMVSFLFIGIKS